MDQKTDERLPSRTKLIGDILAALNAYRMRATYNAVGDVVGITAHSVASFLGEKRPYASWVVSRGTKSPQGYTVDQYHPELYLYHDVIDSESELKALLRKFNLTRNAMRQSDRDSRP